MKPFLIALTACVIVAFCCVLSISPGRVVTVFGKQLSDYTNGAPRRVKIERRVFEVVEGRYLVQETVYNNSYDEDVSIGRRTAWMSKWDIFRSATIPATKDLDKYFPPDTTPKSYPYPVPYPTAGSTPK
jgi:hypothetical protein